jgi:hypothetical protein
LRVVTIPKRLASEEARPHVGHGPLHPWLGQTRRMLLMRRVGNCGCG